PSARMLAIDDGREQRAFSVDREAAAIAVAEDGRTIAVGSEPGVIAIFDVTSGVRLRTLSESRGATRALAFVSEQVVAVSDDGMLRAWDLVHDGPAVEIAAEAGSQMAREPGGS